MNNTADKKEEEQNIYIYSILNSNNAPSYNHIQSLTLYFEYNLPQVINLHKKENLSSSFFPLFFSLKILDRERSSWNKLSNMVLILSKYK